jgi:hypothetical protein
MSFNAGVRNVGWERVSTTAKNLLLRKNVIAVFSFNVLFKWGDNI